MVQTTNPNPTASFTNPNFAKKTVDGFWTDSVYNKLIMYVHNTSLSQQAKISRHFGFPWENKGSDTSRTKNNVKEKFWNRKHPTQIRGVGWLVEKFMPVSNWTEEDIKKMV